MNSAVVKLLTCAIFFLSSMVYARDDITSIISTVYKNKKILLMGEASHDYTEQYLLLHRVLCEVGLDVDFLAFEIDSSKQGAIDDFLSGASPKLASLAENRLSKETVVQVFENILSDVKRINFERSKHGRAAIKVIAADAPMPQEPAQMIPWFLSRDQHMHEKILEKTNNLNGRGIVFMGAAHLAKTSHRWPNPIAGMVEEKDLYAQPLGKRLFESNASIASIWIQGPINAEDQSKIPPDYKSLYLAAGKFINPTVPQIFVSSSAPLIKAETELKVGANDLLSIRKHFDYLVSLPRDYSKDFKSCGAL